MNVARPQRHRSRTRDFVTPEGVNLRLRLAGGSERAIAFAIDAAIIVVALITLTILASAVLSGGGGSAAAIIWLIGFFLLRNFWFIGFESGQRGATPGKRLMKLRVVARDGARLTGGAVVVRNAMREIEVFLPLQFLAVEAATSDLDALIGLLGLAWSGLFLFFPLLNRDRMRIGDLLAGTWVVHVPEARLLPDLAATQDAGPRRRFDERALRLYGIYELQTLEKVLRQGREDSISRVAATIRAKAEIPDDGEDDAAFLNDYYAALVAYLESELVMGRPTDTKHGRRAT